MSKKQTIKFENKVQEVRKNTIVLDEGSGKVINDLWIEFNAIKTERDHASWSEKIKNTMFGTYGSIPLLEVINKFEPKYPNDVIKRDFITEIEDSLNIPKNIRTYKKNILNPLQDRKFAEDGMVGKFIFQFKQSENN